MKSQATTPKKRIASSEWIVNTDTIYDPQASYQVDKALRDLVGRKDALLQEFSGNPERLKERGCRALECSIRWAGMAADREREIEAGKIEWGRLSNLAPQAHESLAAVLRCVVGPGGDAKDFHAVAYGLKQAEAHRRHLSKQEATGAEKAESVRDILATAQAQAATPLVALDALDDIADAAKRKRVAIGKSRKNEGNADKNAFVSIWAEFWFAITGKLPPTEDGSSFEIILRRAWADAGQEDTDDSFRRSVNLARKKLASEKADKIKPFRPHWW